MKNINLLSTVEAHVLVNKAIASYIESLKESPLESIRDAAEYWDSQLSKLSEAVIDTTEIPVENEE